MSGQVVEAPAGRKQLTAHPNPVLLRRRRGKHTEYLHLWKLQLDVIREQNQDLVQNYFAKAWFFTHSGEYVFVLLYVQLKIWSDSNLAKSVLWKYSEDKTQVDNSIMWLGNKWHV